VSQPDQPIVDDAELDDEGTLLMEQRFSIVPEWVLDAEISDAALRLYAVLLRYGQTSGQRMPSRKLLATRMRKKSRDTVDRALKELVGIGAVVVQRRRQGPVNLTNRYVIRSSPPRVGSSARPVELAPTEGGRTDAATPSAVAGGRNSAARGSRRVAATVAAPMRPNPKLLTEREPPPPSPSPAAEAEGDNNGTAPGPQERHLAEALAGHELADVVTRCRDARSRLGLPVGRWTARVLGDVLAAAVAQGWPATDSVPALLAIAADRDTRSPARLSCPGPWWDAVASATAPVTRDDAEATELAQLEARLAEADGARVAVQRRARQELAAEGKPLTRLDVARRAFAMLNSAPALGRPS
jgi:Helix-turn-helix domain